MKRKNILLKSISIIVCFAFLAQSTVYGATPEKSALRPQATGVAVTTAQAGSDVPKMSSAGDDRPSLTLPAVIAAIIVTLAVVNTTLNRSDKMPPQPSGLVQDTNIPASSAETTLIHLDILKVLSRLDETKIPDFFRADSELAPYAATSLAWLKDTYPNAFYSISSITTADGYLVITYSIWHTNANRSSRTTDEFVDYKYKADLSGIKTPKDFDNVLRDFLRLYEQKIRSKENAQNSKSSSAGNVDVFGDGRLVCVPLRIEDIFLGPVDAQAQEIITGDLEKIYTEASKIEINNIEKAEGDIREAIQKQIGSLNPDSFKYEGMIFPTVEERNAEKVTVVYTIEIAKGAAPVKGGYKFALFVKYDRSSVGTLPTVPFHPEGLTTLIEGKVAFVVDQPVKAEAADTSDTAKSASVDTADLSFTAVPIAPNAQFKIVGTISVAA